MKIAVTGANGFIGRYVIDECQRRALIPVSIYHRSQLPAMCSHSAIMLDIKNPPENAFELMGKPDVLIHLAWAGLPNYKSLHHFEEELPAHYSFLKKLIHAGLKNLIVTGTCFEYGMQSGPLSEENLALPTNPYGFSKNSLRIQLQYLQKITPFNLTWARLFYIFGEGQSPTSLLSQLKDAVNRGDAAFNMSGGEQVRDYSPVSEVAKALVSLALTTQDNGIVNICSGKPISIRELVETWIKQHGWSIRLNLGHHPYPDYEPMSFWGNCRKLEACLAASAPR